MKPLEFWPDYSDSLVWTANGTRVSLDDLPLPRDMVERAGRWLSEYDDTKLPWEPTRDDEWLSEGKRLLVDLRQELLNHDFDLQPNEDFWLSPDGEGEGPAS